METEKNNIWSTISKLKDGKLFGESIQFRTEFSLPGADDLQQLAKSAGF